MTFAKNIFIPAATSKVKTRAVKLIIEVDKWVDNTYISLSRFDYIMITKKNSCELIG